MFRQSRDLARAAVMHSDQNPRDGGVPGFLASPLRFWMRRRMGAKVAKDPDAPLGTELWVHWYADRIALVLLGLLATLVVILILLG
jgi:hypothetical protein